LTQMDCKPICDGGAGTVSGSRYIAPDELSIQDSLPGARVQRCGSPVATSKGHWPFEAPTEPTGETSSLKGVKGERLAQ
jgi:hypothetical protein